MVRRYACTWLALIFARLRPPTTRWPLGGRLLTQKQAQQGDLPAPLGPVRNTNSPLPIVSVRSCSAYTPRVYIFETACASITGSSGRPGAPRRLAADAEPRVAPRADRTRRVPRAVRSRTALQRCSDVRHSSRRGRIRPPRRRQARDAPRSGVSQTTTSTGARRGTRSLTLGSTRSALTERPANRQRARARPRAPPRCTPVRHRSPARRQSRPGAGAASAGRRMPSGCRGCPVTAGTTSAPGSPGAPMRTTPEARSNTASRVSARRPSSRSRRCTVGSRSAPASVSNRSFASKNRETHGAVSAVATKRNGCSADGPASTLTTACPAGTSIGPPTQRTLYVRRSPTANGTGPGGGGAGGAGSTRRDSTSGDHVSS